MHLLDRVCYLGDDHLGGAAAYLSGVMAHHGLAFDRVDSAASPDDEFCSRRYRQYVISDYPSARFLPGQMEHIVQCVREGSGLAMFGGWESYYGRLGEYHRSPLAAALPVEMLAADDRRNAAQPCLLSKKCEHPILAGLPWHEPPGVGGYNAVTPKPQTQVLLTGVQFQVTHAGRDWQFTPGDEVPMLVVGKHGAGRTAALATDVAPHWVGGWVDWGSRRITQPIGEGFIEVGEAYALFFANLLRWLGG